MEAGTETSPAHTETRTTDIGDTDLQVSARETSRETGYIVNTNQEDQSDTIWVDTYYIAMPISEYLLLSLKQTIKPVKYSGQLLEVCVHNKNITLDYMRGFY